MGGLSVRSRNLKSLAVRAPQLLLWILLTGFVQPLLGCATTLGPPAYLDISTPLAPAPVVRQDSLQLLRAEQLFVRGMTYLLMDEPERAQSFFGEALELTGEEPAIYSALADVAEALADPLTSVYYAEQAVRLAPAEPAYLMQLAGAQRAAGRLEAARTTLDRLLALDPTHRDAAGARSALSDDPASGAESRPAAVVMRLGGAGADIEEADIEEAYTRAVTDTGARAPVIASLETLVEANQRAARPRFMLGHLYLLDERFAEAAEPLGRSVALDPRLIEAWPLAVTAFRRAGDLDRAADLSEEGLLLFPNNPRLLLADVALALDQGNPDRAADQLAELARLLDESDDVLWQETRRAADEVLTAVPGDARALHAAGWAAYHMGEPDAAIPLLEAATRSNAADTASLEHLGDARMAAGDWVGALGAWSKVLEVDLDNQGVVDKIERTVARYGPPPNTGQ